MTNRTCRAAFHAARAERLKYPLTFGQYKLREAIKMIERWRDLAMTIDERVSTGGKFGSNENLGPCMAYEREAYLKNLPVRLAKLIGYKILPGIAALEGDGVPNAEVKRLLVRAEADAQRLLEDCEAVRLQLKGGLESEYRAMKNGWSHLCGLLKAAADLAQPRPLTSRI